MTNRWEWLEEEYHEDSIGPWTICDDANNDVANIYSDENATGPKISRDESIANVRLIAAAPELLEALRPFATNAFTLDDIERARAAIAKATGGGND